MNLSSQNLTFQWMKMDQIFLMNCEHKAWPSLWKTYLRTDKSYLIQCISLHAFFSTGGLLWIKLFFLIFRILNCKEKIQKLFISCSCWWHKNVFNTLWRGNIISSWFTWEKNSAQVNPWSICYPQMITRNWQCSLQIYPTPYQHIL